jgi:hypothetical protein
VTWTAEGVFEMPLRSDLVSAGQSPASPAAWTLFISCDGQRERRPLPPQSALETYNGLMSAASASIVVWPVMAPAEFFLLETRPRALQPTPIGDTLGAEPPSKRSP